MRRDVFQAIADPIRRAIIALNALQAIPRHLKILMECELPKQEQQGSEIYYVINLKKINKP